VGAERELRQLVNGLDKTKIQELIVNRGVVWRFNPLSAPQFNGLHEILLKAAKRAMFHVIKRADLTDGELTIAIVGAEGLLNSRPITYQSSNVHDERATHTKPIFVQPSWRPVYGCPLVARKRLGNFSDLEQLLVI